MQAFRQEQQGGVSQEQILWLFQYGLGGDSYRRLSLVTKT